MLVTASSAEGARGALATCGIRLVGLCILSRTDQPMTLGVSCYRRGVDLQSRAEVLSSIGLGLVPGGGEVTARTAMRLEVVKARERRAPTRGDMLLRDMPNGIGVEAKTERSTNKVWPCAESSTVADFRVCVALG